MGELPATHAGIQSLQGYWETCQGGDWAGPFPYKDGSTELEMTTIQDPTHRKLRFRKAMHARNDQSTDSWILTFSTSTKPIMVSQVATENFVARWCSGLASPGRFGPETQKRR